MIQEIKNMMFRHNTNSLQIYFNAGGDQINDLSEPFIHEVGDLLEKEDEFLLSNILDYALNQVEIYSNTDGHYLGEQGHIIIELDSDEDSGLSFTKCSTEEFCETITGEIFVGDELIHKDFVTTYIKDISLAAWNSNFTINFSKDLQYTEEVAKILEEVAKLLENLAIKATHNDDKYMVDVEDESIGYTFDVNTMELTYNFEIYEYVED